MNIGEACAKSGGRRFVLTVGASAIYTALFAMSILSEDAYLVLQLATVGAYLTANAHQKHVEITKGNGASN